MEDERLDNLIDELLADMPPVEVPENLSFDAGAIMRKAKEQEEEEGLERVKADPHKGARRSWKKWIAVAAAFAVLAGGIYYGAGSKPGEEPGGLQTGETIEDGEIPLAGPDAPADPGTTEEPGGEEPAQSEENPTQAEEDPQVLAELFLRAYSDESFVKQLTDGDKGYGYIVTGHKDVPEGTEFMVYFYESEEERSAYTVNDEQLRYILWKH